ncbi:FAD-binding and (Fe-S)-binding domain-containing protein [Novilysobacter spongiicola]|uniref:FAD/FMN-containing dehydrogenase n=1 Tax=Lysobacter spongiicola DSM 21749 TaxID=1122188 RepID=A0A1T4R7K4_9GAMM|nr:FAD-binding and (Fe-S)-binding domain-containing protein [Lysobacter spongiicola]SKA11668.1 FAD/FMN-containing dehydrogenase [Lysobacter spongiicola DSM 21749]
MALASDTAHALARELRKRIDGEVRFDAGSRALYATDASNYRQVPIGVVVPRHLDDVVATVAACREFDAPVLSRGGGTSLAGQCCNTAVVLDYSKWCNRIVDIDAEAGTALVEPGCVLDQLRDATAEHGLTFGPDPSTHAHNTLGGMIGNNSCGVHSVTTGRTADNIVALEVLTYDGARFWVGGEDGDEVAEHAGTDGRKGEIYQGLQRLRERYADMVRERYPDIPRRVSGYNLDNLLPDHGVNVARALVGSEGTCVVVLQARLRLTPRPKCRTLVMLGYADVCNAAADVERVLRYEPYGLEGMDEALVAAMRKKNLHPGAIKRLPDGEGWLMAEFGGDDQEDANAAAQRLVDGIGDGGDGDESPSVELVEDPAEQARLWTVREAGLAATAHVPGEHETHPGFEDAAVPPERLGTYLREFRELLRQHDYHCALYGHFGDGCVHCRIDFEVETREGIEKWKRFLDEAADLVVRHGGSLSGEHGDGQARGYLLSKMYGDELVGAFREFKALWDPDGRMNPGKLFDSAVDEHLREGPGLNLPKVASAFDYPEDEHQFSGSSMRCVGVGACRNMTGDVMCPSYRATRDEQHSTRGRARLLHEMLRGETIQDGWRSEAVRDALHLCLACKGCKNDCPVNVDMATYKAEFMARHYQGRMRPRDAYSMGLIFWWSRIASHMPGLANAALHAPGLGRLAKKVGGIAVEREMPRFAKPTFKRWFAGRTPAAGGKPVVLWADTFGNYLTPGPLKAATDVLEAAGYRPIVLQKPLCCGRPLYAEGMLDLARAQLRDTMDALAPYIDQGLPVVGLEPSCVASFREELPRLFPSDGRAHYLADNAFILSEFLDRGDWCPPKLGRRALVHPHCNHHAVMDTDAERRVLERAGVDFAFSNAGCCGMAGSFGFAEDRYEVSLQIAEHELLPKLRQTPDETLLMANGFSCREQIRQLTGRHALDLAEVLQMAIAESESRH